jgi:autophagy-related protein 13
VPGTSSPFRCLPGAVKPRRHAGHTDSSPPDPSQPSTSQLAAHTAYRLGIIHFRALFAFTRLLPAYRLYRKLRRANSGLRLGIKLWAPEGFPGSQAGLAEAWQVMEQGLVSLDIGLDELVSVEDLPPDFHSRRYDFPALDIFGMEYKLSVGYRPEVDFHVEDMETVLSEKFVDMDEDWFTPTVARHRMEDEARAANANASATASSSASASGVTGMGIGNQSASRRVATPTAIPLPSSNPAPIPLRRPSVSSYQARNMGSRVGSQSSVQRRTPGSVGTDRWGALAEGLPFAGPAPTTSTEGSKVSHV